MSEAELKPARAAPPRKGRWRTGAGLRAWALQFVLLALLAALLVALAHNTRVNMAARGIQGGWDFLWQTAGFDIGEHLIAYEPGDAYWRAFAVGLTNTLRVAVTGILLATLAGFVLGVAAFSRNLLVRGLARAYVGDLSQRALAGAVAGLVPAAGRRTVRAQRAHHLGFRGAAQQGGPGCGLAGLVAGAACTGACRSSTASPSRAAFSSAPSSWP